jgi:DNA repair exonuclease SbcCD ATPase subunit
MKPLSLPRKLALLLLLSVGISLATSLVFYRTLNNVVVFSSELTRSSVDQLSRSYELLSQLSEQQASIQFLLRQKDPDEIEKAIKSVEANEKESLRLVNTCGESGASIKNQMEKLAAGKKSVLDPLLMGNAGMAHEQYMTSFSPQFEAVLKEVRDYYEGIKTATAAETQKQAVQIRKTVITCFALLGGALVVLIFVGWRMRNQITRQLTNISDDLLGASQQLAHRSEQVSSSSQTLAEGASEQAASIEETSSSLEEMSSMTLRNSDNAQKANDLATQARVAADSGAVDMQTMSQAMNEIKTSSDDIAKIIKTIDEIAFQTNILALNAAVEAARAGEAGMGFAVVADEVRNLAQRSAQAAKETSEKIELAINKTSQGVQISDKVALQLQGIVSVVRQVYELVAEVSTASKEQSQGIEQVNTAVSQMDKVIQTTAASSEECASAAQELNTQAESLKTSINKLLELVGNHEHKAASTNTVRGPNTEMLDAPRKAAPTRPIAVTPTEKPPLAFEANELASAAANRSAIPLEGDFKNIN